MICEDKNNQGLASLEIDERKKPAGALQIYF